MFILCAAYLLTAELRYECLRAPAVLQGLGSVLECDCQEVLLNRYATSTVSAIQQVCSANSGTACTTVEDNCLRSLIGT